MQPVEEGIIILPCSICWLEEGLRIAQISGNVALELNGGIESCAAFVTLS